MKQKFLLLTVIVLFLTSCTVVIRTGTFKTMDINGAGVIQNPVIVDLDVKQTKVKGTAVSDEPVNTEKDNPKLNLLKSLAIKNALEGVGADILVEPVFETITQDGKTTVTVTGYPATYKNFRPIKKEDVELVKLGLTQKVNTYNYITTGKK